jgi:hypothetical protein
MTTLIKIVMPNDNHLTWATFSFCDVIILSIFTSRYLTNLTGMPIICEITYLFSSIRKKPLTPFHIVINNLSKKEAAKKVTLSLSHSLPLSSTFPSSLSLPLPQVSMHHRHEPSLSFFRFCLPH